MENILLIQFRRNKVIAEQEKECLLKILKNKRVNLISKNLFFDEVNILLKYIDTTNGIIIGGSSEFSFAKKSNYPDLFKKIKKSMPFIKKSIKNNIPVLGICLGHQYLGYIFGSEIMNGQKEFGTFPINLTTAGSKDLLFGGLPNKFLTQQGHEDSIKFLPKKAILLAKSDVCEIEGFKIKGKNVYGVQFHPELNKKDSEDRLEMTKIREKINFKASPLTKEIILNFLDLIKKDSSY